MKDLLSILGLVFEGAFKIGFLERVLPESVQGFRKSLFQKLKDDIELNLVNELQKSVNEWERIGTYIDENNKKEKYTKLVYLFGYHAGRFYGNDKKGAELEKYHMGEDSIEIVWRNADLLFVKEKTLHVIDFKLAGFTSWINRVFEEGISKDERKLPYIPVINHGVPINLSVGDPDFVNFVRAFVEQEEVFDELRYVFVEVKGFAQLLCYAVDYLLEKGRNKDIREVVLELIYPASESFCARFYFTKFHFAKDRLNELEPMRDKIRAIYKNLKEKDSPYQMLDDSFEKIKGKKDRVIKKLNIQIEEFLREMRKRELEEQKVNANSIKECRKDVEKRVKDFLKKKEDCKAICLLHSAGSGKTSIIRECILDSPGKHLVFYLATRLRLLEREQKKIQKEIKKNGRNDIGIVFETSFSGSQGNFKHTGRGFEEVRSNKGIVSRTIDQMLALKNEKNEKNEGIYNQIWAFMTQQAFVDTEMGSTFRHLENLLNRVLLREYQIHIILDEFLGYRNGLYVISEMFKFLQKVKEKGGRANFYILDANGYSPYLLKKLLEEFDQYEVIPDSIVICPFKESVQIERKDISLEVYAKHGYPAEELYIHRKFITWFEKDEDLIKEIVEYVEKAIGEEKEKVTGFLFVQNKSYIVELSRIFWEKGFTTLVATASSKKSQEDINNGVQDIILGTSSVSRGLDFSRPHKPVNHIFILVTDWGIEQNLVEIIQAISRARGDENTEKEAKHIHLIYAIPKETEDIIDNIESLVDFKDKDLIRLIYRKERLNQTLILDDVVCRIIEQFVKSPEGKVFVPIPAQHRNLYKVNKISELESIMTFLEDVYLMEYKRNSDNANKVYEFLNSLSSAVFLYTNDVPKDLRDGNYEYFHPYLLVKKGKVNVIISNEKRKDLLSMLKDITDILSNHDEEKAKKVCNFVRNAASQGQYDITFLLPIYSFVFVSHVLEEGTTLRFRVKKRVGRGNAVVLGGGLGLITRCSVSQPSLREYAVIPLGEDYPYIEVLRGRFAKFPIEFLQKRLEVKDAGVYC